MSVTPDPNTMITISRLPTEADCSVCMNKAPKQICKPRVLTLKDPYNTSVEFTCPQPQELFTVEINREIGMKVKKNKNLIVMFSTVNIHHAQCLFFSFKVFDTISNC